MFQMHGHLFRVLALKKKACILMTQYVQHDQKQECLSVPSGFK